MEENIIITGGTGFAGSRIALYLKQKYPNRNIIITGRNPAKKQEFEKLGFNVQLGDLRDKTFVNNLVIPNSIVIHCAALSSPWGTYAEFYEHNVTVTKNILEASILQDVKKFLYISTPGVYFNFEHRFNVKEYDELPKKKVNFYAETKAIAEEVLIKSTLDCIVFRPRAIIGKGDTVIMPRVLAAYDAGKLKIIGDGKNKVDFTNALNLAHAMYLAIENFDSAKNNIYNITNDESVNLWEILNTVLQKLNRKSIEKKVPYFLACSVAQCMEWTSKYITKKEPILTKYGIGILAKSITLNVENAKEKLNYTPIQNTQEGIEEYVNWYKKTVL